jgi:hypothetical protein
MDYLQWISKGSKNKSRQDYRINRTIACLLPAYPVILSALAFRLPAPTASSRAQRWRWCTGDFQPLPGSRVDKAQLLRVQAVSHIARQCIGAFGRSTSCCIEPVPGERMPGCCHVDTDLVGAAGCEPHLDDRLAVITFQHLDLAERGLSARRSGIHASQDRVRHRTDRDFDSKLIPFNEA